MDLQNKNNENKSTRYEIITSLGKLEIELFVQQAPKTCENFLAYLEAGCYKATSFFRIVTKNHPQQHSNAKIEVIQGGPKYGDKGHDRARMLFPLTHESTQQTGLKHLDGSLAMGRFAIGESYGGFFFCVGDQPELDYGGKRFSDGQGTAVFAQLRKGRGVLTQIFNCAEMHEHIENEISIECIRSL